MQNTFQELGYFKEYYINNKFIGTLPCEKDREVIGYNGRQKETLQNKIVFKNKKSIKAGTEVYTFLYPLTGKIK
jgi:hypothetical protein